MTLNGYGVTEESGKLEVRATPDNFALRKHSLLQAILAVNDMFYLAEPHVASLFFEDVRNWLDASDVRYSEQISFIGRSGYARKFDFLITKSSKAPERILKTINNPVRNSADSIIIDWVDTKEVRPENSKAYAVIKQNVFMRGDFEDLGRYDQIGRMLHLLIKEKMLIRIGHGLYASSGASDFVPLPHHAGFSEPPVWRG